MSDLSTKVLIEIREELKTTRTDLRAGLDEVRAGLNEVRTELNEVRTELSSRLDVVAKRQTESEMRLATELVAVAHAVHLVRDELRESRVLHTQVHDHEKRIARLEKDTA